MDIGADLRKAYEDGYADGKRDATPKWISVEERLPEDNAYVLVWFEYFRYGNINCHCRSIGISNTFFGNWSGIVNGSSGWRDLRVLAWMPLPKPPKEEE